ncbi:GIN domain-containing protein [Solitalea lacus]|uniref:GIN domain-containing protein n=1 Tax=Solitalea lacus TaxID=2911172 RepID=UPI001EDBF0D4|nr:DUF2807 domain-containing protein [Solitalea lacus]UKJ05835.1 DUF2807 domain-containing protein [Solitalea lacus]
MIKQLGAAVAVVLLSMNLMSFTVLNDEIKSKKEKKEVTAIKRDMNVAPFEIVKVSGNFKVILTQGDEQKVVVDAPEELNGMVQSFIVDNELNVFTNGVNKKKITLWITLKDIHNISTYGDVKVVKN